MPLCVLLFFPPYRTVGMAAKFELAKLLGAQERLRREEENKPKNVLRGGHLRSSSSSSNGFGGIAPSDSMQLISEESMAPTLRHEVSQDRRAALDSASSMDLSPSNTLMSGTEDANMPMSVDEDSRASTATPRQRQSLVASAAQTHITRNPKYNFPTQQFHHQVPVPGKPEEKVMLSSEYHDVTEYHLRVCMAINYKTRNPLKPDGTKNAPTKYSYRIYSRPSVILLKLLQERRNPESELRHAFVVVDENEPIFEFADYDLPSECVEPAVHGSNLLDLVGYATAVIRLLESQILAVNLLCFGDGYVPFVSNENAKWSAHCHMAFPHNARVALATVRKQCADRIAEAYKDQVKSAKPLIFRRTNKAGKEELMHFADNKIFTKKRNFRAPYATKADKTASLVPTDAVPLWNRPESDMCASDKPFEGLSTSMITCRTSIEMWNANNVRNPKVLEAARGTDTKNPQLDVVTFQSDFRCLPVTGNSAIYVKKILYDSKDGGCPPVILTEKYLKSDSNTGKYEWRTMKDRIGGVIDECIEWVFKLLYSDSWTEVKRNALLHGGSEQGMVEGIVELCRISPLHTQAFLALLPHAYQPGKPLNQEFINGADPMIDVVLEAASGIADAFQPILKTEARIVSAWRELWEFRTLVELSYSNTSTRAQRAARKEYLDNLGERASVVFTSAVLERTDAKLDVRECCRDVAFMDTFATELLIWSGQAVYTFQREACAENLPILNVLCTTEDEYSHLLEKCMIYTCTRLGRTPDVPASAITVHAPMFRVEDSIDSLAADLQKVIGGIGETKIWRENRHWKGLL